MQLKKVRLRTTFASADTALDSVKLACCEHYANVLYEYSNSELKAVSGKDTGGGEGEERRGTLMCVRVCVLHACVKHVSVVLCVLWESPQVISFYSCLHFFVTEACLTHSL